MLRPRLNAKQQRRFVTLLLRHLGKRYDTAAAYMTMARLGVERATGFALGQRGASASLIQNRMICTDTTLSALCSVSRAFRNSILHCTPPLDCVRFRNGSASLEDVLRLHRYRPGLLVRIPLPLQLFSNTPPPVARLSLQGALSAAGRLTGSAAQALGKAGARAVETALRGHAAGPESRKAPLLRAETLAGARRREARALRFRTALESVLKAVAKSVSGTRMGAAFAFALSILIWTKRRRFLFAIVKLMLVLLASRIALRQAYRSKL